ncbi:alpha/beta hydrolase [Lichenihabitans sp. Uapishka_5]|uniref:alpha/beta hydrolase n=1 Tax=Lichenihabitans sp. Uapishka_5 TaxID=3037302 RepID=UPI0029E7F8C3|nr:alpha/beta hydrolase [Lichenihabitans sp. Uapishka_5]MDX7950000.1 alpha/beta hydrolase [Lichenihabitans sp. Uapishka_5]
MGATGGPSSGRAQLDTDTPATLVQLAQRHAPPGATVEWLHRLGGIRLRVARWKPEVARGTVLVCTGRGEFIEKYFEVVDDLLRRHLAVVVFDWRGQGLSSRTLTNRRKGHVASFADYDADLAGLVDEVLEPTCPKPFFGLAHSMGGTVMLRHAAGACAFERIVLSAPMIAVDRLKATGFLRVMSGLASACGLGGLFVPTGERTAVLEEGFVDNVLTTDPVRFADMMAVSRAEPRLTVDAPTIGWLRAALAAMAPMAGFDFPARIAAPILMVVPGDDRVVSVAAMERFGQRLKAGTLVSIPGARHEILMERDVLRHRFWAAFDAFVPGTTTPVAEAPPLSRAGGRS